MAFGDMYKELGAVPMGMPTKNLNLRTGELGYEDMSPSGQALRGLTENTEARRKEQAHREKRKTDAMSFYQTMRSLHEPEKAFQLTKTEYPYLFGVEMGRPTEDDIGMKRDKLRADIDKTRATTPTDEDRLLGRDATRAATEHRRATTPTDEDRYLDREKTRTAIETSRAQQDRLGARAEYLRSKAKETEETAAKDTGSGPKPDTESGRFSADLNKFRAGNLSEQEVRDLWPDETKQKKIAEFAKRITAPQRNEDFRAGTGGFGSNIKSYFSKNQAEINRATQKVIDTITSQKALEDFIKDFNERPQKYKNVDMDALMEAFDIAYDDE